MAKRPNDLSFNCYALDKFTFNKFIKDSRLNYCCNVFSTFEARRYLRKRTLRKNLKSFFGLEPFLSGSDGHSVGLNVITKELRKFEGHNVIADSDVAMITKNWDTKLIDIFVTIIFWVQPMKILVVSVWTINRTNLQKLSQCELVGPQR